MEHNANAQVDKEKVFKSLKETLTCADTEGRHITLCHVSEIDGNAELEWIVKASKQILQAGEYVFAFFFGNQPVYEAKNPMYS